jgi:hypothetical protein
MSHCARETREKNFTGKKDVETTNQKEKGGKILHV